MNRYYVSLTWHDWPNGGSFGTAVEARTLAEAEELAKREMAESLANEGDDVERIYSIYAHRWHVVDCFEIKSFIAWMTSAT